jgi:hypothetical protein
VPIIPLISSSCPTPPNTVLSVEKCSLYAGEEDHQLEHEADRVWSLMKSFSLLVVKDGSASMHRLLQQVIT